MKKSIFKKLILLTIIAIAFQACEKDSDSDPSNSSGDRSKFLGSWITTSNGAVHGTLNFTMNITAGTSSPSQIIIENFDAEGQGTYVIASTNGNSITILQQVVNGDNIEGSGSYNASNTLTFTYTLSDGQTVDNRTATAHK